MKKVVSLLLFVLPLLVFAQKADKHTLSYNFIKGSPDANISELKWISGYWQGEAFGGLIEEVWSDPLGNSMMGMFKAIHGNQVSFYELITITEVNGSLLLRLKHFDKHMNGWEASDESLEFKLVKLEPHKVFFDGYTFELVNNFEMNVYVRSENEDGKDSEMKFIYTRVK